MIIVEEIIQQAQLQAKGRAIKDVRIGLGYTCVALENNDCGLAYTFRDGLGHGCSVLAEAGRLIGQPCEGLIAWLKEKNLIKAAIGLATINAILNNPASRWQGGNIIDTIEIKPEETFGMVGAFGPILPVVKAKTKNIYIFELDPVDKTGIYSADTIPTHLPKCDVVVITATSIINHTIDDVLPYCKGAKHIFILGPSTPIAPEVFKKYNVTTLAGSVVTDTEQILQIVSQGGGTMNMRPALKHILADI